MNVKVYIDIYNIPLRKAVVRYIVDPAEAAGIGNAEEVNLVVVDSISENVEGARSVLIPTCEDPTLAETATDLDRKVYEKLVNDGYLTANILGVEISLRNYYADNIPMVDFECEITGCDGVIARTINPFEPKDTPKLPMFVWEAAAAKAWETVRRFAELAGKNVSALEADGE